MSALRVAVLSGSTRPNRRSRTVAEWVCAEAKVDGLDLVLVDLHEVGLPMLAEPSPAAFGAYTMRQTRDWSELIAGFDGYVLVSPEYNHSTTAALKNALDHLYAEWRDKAVGFVGYGVDGGVRAIEHLRAISAELGMAGVGPAVALNLFEDFDDEGRCVPRQRQVDALTRMLTDLDRWAGALRSVRRSPAPSGTQTSDAEAGDAHAGDAESGAAEASAAASGRPSLNQPIHAADAAEAVRRLVDSLQRGGERGDADLFDGMFAADVFWGSPYGLVLSGYDQLNAIHHMMMEKPIVSRSRFEPVQTLAPANDVVVTHVRRQSLPDADSADAPGFSEMAMYVLVRRDGQWWLAGGQNTLIADPA